MVAESDPAHGVDTVVLIHGLWMTPRSWDHWVAHYTDRGFNVVAPAYPGFEIEVEALRDDPRRIAELTIPETVEHLAGIVRGFERPPILIGHSFGGVLTQLLLDRGLGGVGVAIDSVPTEGVRTSPPSQVKSLFSFLKNPANRHRAVGFSPAEFHYAFTNTLTEEVSQQVFDRFHIPAPGGWVWSGVLDNWTPGHQDRWVDYGNTERAPLLFIAGGEDNIMPAAVNRSNASKYHGAGTITNYHEFPGRSHYTIGEPDWQAVADYALDWACRHIPSESTVAVGLG